MSIEDVVARNDTSLAQYRYVADASREPRIADWEKRRGLIAEGVDPDEGAYQANDVEVRERRREVFALFDFGKTGTIASEDLGTVLRALGFNVTESCVDGLVNAYDNDGTGTLDYPEFCRIIDENQPMRAPPRRDAVLAFFKTFDRNRDGTLPGADFVRLMRDMGEPLDQGDIDGLLREAVIDGDQRIDIEQFVDQMLATSRPEEFELKEKAAIEAERTGVDQW